jgi:polar amino acid transport system substrate-binding protein
MNMKKWLAAAVACSGLMLAACGGQGNATADAGKDASAAASSPAAGKTYTVGLNAEFAPFESQGAGGEIEGFDVDILNAMAKAGGFQVSFKNQPWDGLFASLNHGDFDMLASAVTITDERRQSMDFSAPYFEITQVVLVPKGKDIKSVDDLKNMNRVGVVTGNTGDLAAQKILGATSPKIARFESLPLVLKEVEGGGVDAVISDSAVVGNYIKNNGDKGFSMITVPDFEVEHYGIAVRKGDTATLNLLNESLQKIRDSGEYMEIHKKYFAQ